MNNKLFVKLLKAKDSVTITEGEATKILEHVVALETEIEELNETIEALSEG